VSARDQVQSFLEEESDPPPMVMEEETPAIEMTAAAPPSEGISLDSMRGAMIANFEQADLDVPAFLRKRNETM
jgi:hypothetical protein